MTATASTMVCRRTSLRQPSHDLPTMGHHRSPAAHIARILCFVIVAIVVAATADGCGSTYSSATVAHATVPVSTAFVSSARPPSKADAVAYAHAVNLRSADLPTMVLVSPEQTVATGGSSSLSHCLGGAHSVGPITEMNGPTFKGNSALRREAVLARIYSTVAVMPSAALAAKDVEEGASRRGRACVAQYWKELDSNRATSRLTYGEVTLAPLPLALASVRHEYGNRVTIPTTVTATGAQVPRYVDSYEFAVGRADIQLTVIISPLPFPTSTERLLLSVLAARAKAHSL